jgi:hypothetical protein
MMAISRADLLKQLLPGLNQLFGLAYDNQAKIDQILANDAAKEKEFIGRAGETFRNDVKIAQIKATDLKKKEEGDEHRSISKSS